MTMTKILIASVASFSFLELSEIKESTILANFWLSAFYRHIVGDQPTFDVVLADERQRSLRQCKGQFSPCTYLGVGPLIHVSPPFETPVGTGNDYDLIMDCGVLLDISQRYPLPWQPPPPHIDPDKLREGVWIAALGNVHFYPGPLRAISAVRCKPMGVSLLDMRPNSNAFGSIRPWEFGRRLPHDPDVLPFPTVFVSFEILSNSTEPIER